MRMLLLRQRAQSLRQRRFVEGRRRIEERKVHQA